MTAQLFNIFDTLCGWCFVAHNETRKLVDDLPDDIAVQHLHRKLFVGPHEMDINDGMISMVRRVGQEIAPQKTGARISDAHIDFLCRPGTRYNSELTARAFAGAQSLAPHEAYKFGVALQKAVFETGLDFNDPKAMADLFEKVTQGDRAAFLEALQAPETARKAEVTATLARKLMTQVGSNGVPCLILSVDDHLVQIDPYNAKAARAEILSRL